MQSSSKHKCILWETEEGKFYVINKILNLVCFIFKFFTKTQFYTEYLNNVMKTQYF